MITFIIQARSGSTRLPNKILIPFYKGQTILDLMIKKLLTINETKIIIATTTNPKDNAIAEVAAKHNITCFRGSENDVLDRFISAAEAFGTQQIIRVCSDNPFLDINSIKVLIESINTNPNADYISFDINGTPSIKTHYGFWTEYVTLTALKKVRSLTYEQLYHEHVTNYIYSHPNEFNLIWIKNSNKEITQLPIRLTIDTLKDFKNAQKIYTYLAESKSDQNISNITKYLCEHPSIITEMENEIKNNSK